MGMLTISMDRTSDVMTIKFDHRNPRFAKEIADTTLNIPHFTE